MRAKLHLKCPQCKKVELYSPLAIKQGKVECFYCSYVFTVKSNSE